MSPRQRSLVDSSKNPEATLLNTILDAYMLENGMRVTSQRRVIIEVFLATGAHVSVDELSVMVRQQDARIGYATVYRTMKMLTACGVVNERHFDDGIARYELSRKDQHHDHLICTVCGRIVEFADLKIESLQSTLAKSHGFRLTHHRHELYGICSVCDKTRPSALQGTASDGGRPK